MKKTIILLLLAALLLGLTGCGSELGGKYKLDYITTDGVRLPPSSFGMNISFELQEDGVGTAVYGGTSLDITWAEDGSELVLTGPNGELRLTRNGSELILHSDGTLLFFTPEEEEE